MSLIPAYKIAVSIEGGNTIGHCPAVLYKNKIWLVPAWTGTPDGKEKRPERLILMEQFPHQKIEGNIDYGHYAVNVPIPKVVWDGPIQKAKEAKFVVLDGADVEIGNETLH